MNWFKCNHGEYIVAHSFSIFPVFDTSTENSNLFHNLYNINNNQFHIYKTFFSSYIYHVKVFHYHTKIAQYVTCRSTIYIKRRSTKK